MSHGLVYDTGLDYCAEIEWFDQHLGRMLKSLEDAGELDNTLVMVTSDNGMQFGSHGSHCADFHSIALRNSNSHYGPSPGQTGDWRAQAL